MEESNNPIEVNVNHTNACFNRIPLDDVAGMLHWPEVLLPEQANRFYEFLNLANLFSNEENAINRLSDCWMLLSKKNCNQLLEHGYNNFKRTIGHNYFNFLVQKGDPQIQAVEKVLSQAIVEQCRNKALCIPHDPTFETRDQFSYKYFIFLLWEYVKLIDNKKYLKKLDEPNEGNPILVHEDGKNMSQDLANSIIEYYSMSEVVSFNNMHTVLEIGAGYGRNAHVTLSLNSHIKMVLVDIFPALYISQQYLSSIFKKKKIFKAQKFSSYSDIKNEIDEADIIFLLPHQLEYFPDKFFDFTLNISSFGEMSLKQIHWYFRQINRLTRHYFYTKQWNVSKNPFDGLELTKNDYPYPATWKQIYSRNCVIQNDFFETIFQMENT